MKHKEFREASSNFSALLDFLYETTENIIPQAKYLLEGNDPHPFDIQDRESAAGIVLRDMGERIDDLLSTFDKMLESINMPPRYKKFFELPE